jgi:peptide/nickel transport system substrate-binding protein
LERSISPAAKGGQDKKRRNFMTGPMRRFLFVGGMVFLLAFVFIAADHGLAAAEQKGTVTIATTTPMFYGRGGDPASHSSGYPVISQHIFDSLIWADRDQNQKPALAKSWTVKGGWTDMTFDLRDDVKFHNGDPLTADDVKFSLETYLRPELKYIFQPMWKANLKLVEVLGPHKIRIVLNHPDPGFLGRLWWGGGIMPKKYREQVGDAGFADKPIGTGPFRWLDYKQDQYWRAEAVPKHFRYTPTFKELKVVYVPEHSTRLAMLKAGEADLIDAIGPHIPEIKANPKLRVIYCMYPYLQTLGLADLVAPNEPSPFLDVRVRKAASLAIDRETIVKKVLFGAGEPYGEAVAPITWGFDPTIKPDPYNPEQAKALLTQAGYPNGFSTSISTLAGSKFWLEAIAGNLADVGIKAEIKVFEGGAYQDAWRARKLRGLVSRVLWWHSEKHAAADASDFFIKGGPSAYLTTDKISEDVIAGMSAESEADMIAVGKKLSKEIRDSQMQIILWAAYVPYGVSDKIAFWEPQLGAIPATAWELIRLK